MPGRSISAQWWLKQVVDANGFALSTTVPVFQWAFGIYSDRYSSVPGVAQQRDETVVPDDGANQGLEPCGCSSALRLISLTTRRWNRALPEAEKYCPVTRIQFCL